jgi:hypothetical protein
LKIAMQSALGILERPKSVYLSVYIIVFGLFE